MLSLQTFSSECCATSTSAEVSSRAVPAFERGLLREGGAGPALSALQSHALRLEPLLAAGWQQETRI